MRAFGAAIAGVLIVAVLSVVLWVFGIIGSAMEVGSKTFDADNIIQQYEQFHDRCAAIQRYEHSLSVQRELLESAEGSDKSRISANIGGLEAQRQGAISQYNADSTKTNVGVFQGRTLPEKLDPSTPTVCGEY